MNVIQKIDSSLLNNRLKVLRAFVVKDIKHLFRFKILILNYIFSPVLNMLSYLLVYAAVFLNPKVNDLGYVQQSNYLIYLLTGFLAYSFFHLTFGKTTLNLEKYMQTLDGILLTPRNRLYIMLGKASQALIEVLGSVVIFIVLIALVNPTVDWPRLGLGSLALFLMFIFFLSFDFIIAAVGLTEEGLASFLVNYAPRAFLVAGAVYYPKEAIPKVFHFLVYLNPVYHGVNLFRSAFMQADLPFGLAIPIIFLVILAIIMPILCVFIFDYILKKWGVRGY